MNWHSKSPSDLVALVLRSFVITMMSRVVCLLGMRFRMSLSGRGDCGIIKSFKFYDDEDDDGRVFFKEDYKKILPYFLLSVYI